MGKKVLCKSIVMIIPLLSGCINLSDPVIPAVYQKKYIAEIVLKPPYITRTSATKDFWPSMITMQLAATELVSLGRPVDSGPQIDTLINGLRIGLFFGITHPLQQYVDTSNMWKILQSADTTAVFAYVDVRNEVANMSASGKEAPVFECTIGAKILKASSAIVNASLQPIYGKDGFVYGANMAIPRDGTKYSFEIAVNAPRATARDSANRDRILDNIIVQFMSPSFDTSFASDGMIGDTVLSDSIRVVAIATPPETLWIWSSLIGAFEMIPPSANASTFIIVKIFDLKSLSTADAVGYVPERTIRLFSELRTDSTAAVSLVPVHGQSGFYYVASVQPPVPGTGGDGDGHQH